MPGATPFLRGFRAAHGERPWDIRQLYAQADPADANSAIIEDLHLVTVLSMLKTWVTVVIIVVLVSVHF